MIPDWRCQSMKIQHRWNMNIRSYMCVLCGLYFHLLKWETTNWEIDKGKKYGCTWCYIQWIKTKVRNHIDSSIEKIVASLKTMTQWDWWTVHLLCNRYLCVAIFRMTQHLYDMCLALCAVEVLTVSIENFTWSWCHRHLRFTNVCSPHTPIQYSTLLSDTSAIRHRYLESCFIPMHSGLLISFYGSLSNCIQLFIRCTSISNLWVFNFVHRNRNHVDQSQFHAWHFWIRHWLACTII